MPGLEFEYLESQAYLDLSNDLSEVKGDADLFFLRDLKSLKNVWKSFFLKIGNLTTLGKAIFFRW